MERQYIFFLRLFRYFYNRLWQIKNSSKFLSLGKGCVIYHPILISKNQIELGNFVTIWHGARIQAITEYLSIKYNPRIVLCDRVSMQQNIHLTCANYIYIGENTAIAANVTITDIHHPYDNIEKPIEMQDLIVGEVIIGSDCKIYNNVVILSNVHIGKHVTIGANSVVTRDIPDFCVAVGSPAYIIKRYNNVSQIWEKTGPSGNFITN